MGGGCNDCTHVKIIDCSPISVVYLCKSKPRIIHWPIGFWKSMELCNEKNNNNDCVERR